MRFLTDFADQAVVLPVMFLVALVLVLLGWRRGAVGWLVGVAGTLGVMLVLKLAFRACGDLLPDVALHNPSGHTAAAAVTYGGFVALLGASGGTALATAMGAAIVFGFTRVALGAHTPPEVLLGGAVGLAGVALLVRLAGRPPPFARRNYGLVAVCLVGFLVFHGAHVKAENAIGRLAHLLETWPLSACKADMTGAG